MDPTNFEACLIEALNTGHQMALFSKSKILLFGGVRQEKPLTSTQFSNDQLILYHLESFNELLKGKNFATTRT